MRATFKSILPGLTVVAGLVAIVLSAGAGLIGPG